MAADSWEMAGEQKAPYNQLQLSGMGGRTEASFKNSTTLVKRPAVMPTTLAHSFFKHCSLNPYLSYSSPAPKVGESGNSTGKGSFVIPKVKESDGLVFQRELHV